MPAARDLPTQKTKTYSRKYTYPKFIFSFWTFLLCILVISNSSAQSTASKDLKCKDVSLEESIKLASVVVSGTVRKIWNDELHSTNNNPRFKAELEVKRIFRGDKIVNSKSTASPGLWRVHRIITVQGFGDPNICDNMVRERDTKIFMLNANDKGELKLNSSLASLTLHNLDYVNAIIHGKT